MSDWGRIKIAISELQTPWLPTLGDCGRSRRSDVRRARLALVRLRTRASFGVTSVVSDAVVVVVSVVVGKANESDHQLADTPRATAATEVVVEVQVYLRQLRQQRQQRQQTQRTAEINGQLSGKTELPS